MALVLGTNCGFVTAAPTDNPAGSLSTIDAFSYALKVVSGASAPTITEIGWWCASATQASNFEVGIYTHDAVNNRPGTVISSSIVNAKGTTSGWKTVSGLNIVLEASTTYWLAFQLDNTSTTTYTHYTTDATQKYDYKSGSGSLPDPWGASSGTGGRLVAIYALIGTPATSISGTIAATSSVSGDITLHNLTRLSLAGSIAGTSSVSGSATTRIALGAFPRHRPDVYDEDSVWNEETGTWGSDPTLLKSGGSRYHEQLVVVAKDLIYYAEVT